MADERAMPALPEVAVEAALHAWFERDGEPLCIANYKLARDANMRAMPDRIRAVLTAALPFLVAQAADAREDARDAARWRFVRGQEYNTAGIPFIARNDGHGFSMWTGEHADAAIDAAMTEASDGTG
jgi:hypothetical protein